ncbi:MAG: glycerate kinase [Candidatus Bathyarchaeota archaeon]|nr:MAG: glycerate kinase [Candidatus Bathyarchaeota archaeon]
MRIENKKELLSRRSKRGREIVLDIIEHALKAVNPYEVTKKLVYIENGRKLIVCDLSYDLSKVGNIYVVGAGKATFPIAQALDEILRDRIKRGTINVKRGEKRRLKHIKVRETGHPIPDETGLEGAKEIVEIAKEAKEEDLVFACITGGASALTPLPAEGISLEDKKRVTDLLLKCGATIDEINAVRKNISAIKGGRLAMYIHPAEIINLIVMDEVPGLPWGPTVPDITTFKDAVRSLKKYDLWEKIPISVRNHLERGLTDVTLETPKPKEFESLKVHNVILTNNEVACEAAKKRAEETGFNSMILSTVLEGESREAGIVLAGIAKEIEERGRPLKPPCVLILGGETTVTITGQSGEGGPSQEFALGFALKIAGSKNIVVVSIDTDGTDGPTDIAGGIADGYTMERAKEKGISVYENLVRHNSSHVLKELGDAVITGPTGTNVMDLNVIVILDEINHEE